MFLDFNIRYSVIRVDLHVYMPSVRWKTFPVKSIPFLNNCSNHYLKQNVDFANRPTRSAEAILNLIFTAVGTNVRNISIDRTFGQHLIMQL